MSYVGTIYDAIISKCNTLFPTKNRLHNPYELQDNPEIIIKDSWGLKVLSASHVEIENCTLSVARSYNFLLVRQFATVGTKETAFDTVTKSILEDQKLFLDNIYSLSELGIESTIDQIEIGDISGIEFLQTDQKKYLFTEITFKITSSVLVIN
jgi:hypothetical protein